MISRKGFADGERSSGQFQIADGRNILGDLSVTDDTASLYLHDPDFFHISSKQAQYIPGTLHDKTKVTCLYCFTRSGTGSASRHNEHYNFAEIEHAYILSGNRYLDNNNPSIDKMTFHVDDAENIFRDFDALGEVVDPTRIIDAVMNENREWTERPIDSGPNPSILYFSGKTEVLIIPTEFGTVRIFHRISSSGMMYIPRGIGIHLTTYIELSFNNPQFFVDALKKVIEIRRFIGMIAGRPQNIDDIWIDTVGDKFPLNLHWIRRPRRLSTWEQQAPHSSEVLLSAVEEPDEFATVLQSWLKSEPPRQNARVRFESGFEQQRNFPIDRLVSAANMFDILPKDAFQPPEPIAIDVNDAKQHAKALFRSLPDSFERSSILNALGRLGSLTLRSKVQQRAMLVSQSLKAPLIYLDDVIDEAVKCRNYYVHGSPGSFNYTDHSGILIFFSRALEFIYGASELIEAGWDIQNWRNRGGIGSHPFTGTLVEWDHYALKVHELRGSRREE